MQGVSERDRKVWLRRYLYQEPAAEVAKDFGIKETRVNVIKSQTDRVFTDAVYAWFIAMSEKYF